MTEPLATATTCRVVTRGRRTGREHVVTVWFALVGRTVYAPARHGWHSDWVRNALAADSVVVRHRGLAWTGVCRPVDGGERTRAVAALVEKYARHRDVVRSWGADPPVVVALDLGEDRAATAATPDGPQATHPTRR